MQPVTLEELKKVIALSDLPDEHLQWILTRSEYREYEDGGIVVRTSDPAEHLWMIIEGKLRYYNDMNGTLVYYFTFENNSEVGGISGLIPHSRMKISNGCSYADGKLRILLLHKKYFEELEQLNPVFIQRLIGFMTERAKAFATIQLQHEKVSALGKLSVGIAHELNNPASAINRISGELTKRMRLNFELTAKLLQYNIGAQQIQDIIRMAQEKETAPKIKLTALQQIDKEDEMAEWLEKKGLAESRRISEAFSEFGFSIPDFENIRTTINGDAFIHLLMWLENMVSSQRIIKDLEEASGRISNLVGAIKSHVHMDGTNDMKFTNIHSDLENTLRLLGHQLREKNITVKKNFSASLPEVEAYIGELNQVWTNVIDNAIYALDKNGELTIETSCDKNNVTVSIADNGSGIPPEIRSRIFDPFFTTKKVGQGSGIGLDLVNRIIKRHNGEIKVNSMPGKTEFVISIPIKQRQEEKQDRINKGS